MWMVKVILSIFYYQYAVPSQPFSCIVSPREGDGHVSARRTHVLISLLLIPLAVAIGPAGCL